VNKKQTEKVEAIKHLRKLLKRGSTVYTVLRSVSKSGMSRRIDLYTVKKNQIVFITGLVCHALEYSLPGKHQGLFVQGCMDMGLHLVHSLSYALHGMDNHDSKGNRRSGYTLEHRWI
jgi:hypothetical protein